MLLMNVFEMGPLNLEVPNWNRSSQLQTLKLLRKIQKFAKNQQTERVNVTKYEGAGVLKREGSEHCSYDVIFFVAIYVVPPYTMIMDLF